MRDQADELRKLVIRHERRGPSAPRSLRTVIVAGGHGGSGASTVAIGLARSFVRSGLRTALIDADRLCPDAAARCGCTTGPNLEDVALGQSGLLQALQATPPGLHVLAGRRAHEASEWTALGQERLLKAIGSLEGHFDRVVIDTGAGWDRAGRFWQAADAVLLVTCSDAISIMDAYAAVKLHGEQTTAPLVAVVNRTQHAGTAHEVFQRLARSCQRFLDQRISLAGWLPDNAAADATEWNALLDEIGRSVESRLAPALGGWRRRAA